MIKWIFIALIGIIFFSMVVPGCIQGCNRQIGIEKPKSKKDNAEKTDGDQEQDTSSGPGLLDRIFGKEEIIPEQTFRIFYLTPKRPDGTRDTLLVTERLWTPWQGQILDSLYGKEVRFRIEPDPGNTLSAKMPGFYTGKHQWNEWPPVILRGGQSNPPLPPRAKNGDIIIKSAAGQ